MSLIPLPPQEQERRKNNAWVFILCLGFYAAGVISEMFFREYVVKKEYVQEKPWRR